MTISGILLGELEHEAMSTRKMLERVPTEHLNWKPHEKSYSLSGLASHIAEIHTWVGYTIKQDELDFGKFDYKPFKATTTKELLAAFDKNVADAKADLKDVTDEAIRESWTLKNNDQVYFTMPKIAVLRTMVVKHIVHHRGQLSVYLRLLDIPVPGMYGPTADER